MTERPSKTAVNNRKGEPLLALLFYQKALLVPNRILRDWTDSFAVNDLDAHEERFFVRLIMKADDFGRFHADTRLLKANLFPLLPDIRDTDISRWIAACEKAGLIRCYVDGRGRQFLEIQNFRQRTRQSESRFPAPSEN